MPMISLAELQRRIAQGDLSPEAAIAQSLEAIDAQDKTIGAFVGRAESPRAAGAGPLRGVAVGIKDITTHLICRPRWAARPSMAAGGRARMRLW
jgi:Asp-tRNA(Asn)/Glu-tRNA(Gln) amidotransferase A subunit family amidase